MKNHTLFKEGLTSLGVTIGITIILYLLYPWLALFGIGIIIFVLYFFRDPERMIINEDAAILAPADGLITDITEVDETIYLKERAIRISIFMSPMDVHINRSPIDGKVDYIEYRKGKFIPATNPKSHQINEKNFIGIYNDDMKVLVVQIAGIMARRIVDWTKKDQLVTKGEKIGMIKFSSGTQVFLPLNSEILVKKGEKVFSGKTIIGRYPNDK